MTTANKIGMVGGYPIGEVNRLFHAFMNGALSVNDGIKFKVTFIGSWYDPPKAKEAAMAQVEAGVDVMYADMYLSAQVDNLKDYMHSRSLAKVVQVYSEQ